MIVHGEGLRYVVSEIQGYSEKSGGYPSTDFAVLDSDYCYREVATFVAAVGRRIRTRRRAALRLCDRLNRVAV